MQESCSPDEAKLLDKVMEFLKREGLYSPQMKDMRVEDPVATDLIGALLTVGFCRFLSSSSSSRFHLDLYFFVSPTARTHKYNFITTKLKRFGCAILQSTKLHVAADETERQFHYQQFAAKFSRLEFRYIPFGADNRTSSISVFGHGRSTLFA